MRRNCEISMYIKDNIFPLLFYPYHIFLISHWEHHHFLKLKCAAWSFPLCLTLTPPPTVTFTLVVPSYFAGLSDVNLSSTTFSLQICQHICRSTFTPWPSIVPRQMTRILHQKLDAGHTGAIPDDTSDLVPFFACCRLKRWRPYIRESDEVAKL